MLNFNKKEVVYVSYIDEDKENFNRKVRVMVGRTRGEKELKINGNFFSKLRQITNNETAVRIAFRVLIVLYREQAHRVELGIILLRIFTRFYKEARLKTISGDEKSELRAKNAVPGLHSVISL